MTLIMIASGIFMNKIPTDLRNLSLFIGLSSLEITAVPFCMSVAANVSLAFLFARHMEQKK